MAADSVIPDYLRRFDAMVGELRRGALDAKLLNYALFDPVPPATIAAAESALGHSLDRSIVDFFRLTNGLQLRWTSSAETPSIGNTQSVDRPFEWLLPWKLRLGDTAVINILPFEMIFLNDWKGFTWFGSETGDQYFLGSRYDRLAFSKSIKPFDAFNGFYSMVFFVGAGGVDPKVLLASDNLADFTSSKITNFASYLEFLLSTRGVVAKRQEFYSDEWNSSTRAKGLLVTPREYWDAE
jgi:hypothetical protein